MSSVLAQYRWEHSKKTEKEIKRLKWSLNGTLINAQVLRNQLESGWREKPSDVPFAEWMRNKRLEEQHGGSLLFKKLDDEKKKHVEKLEERAALILRVIERHYDAKETEKKKRKNRHKE